MSSDIKDENSFGKKKSMTNEFKTSGLDESKTQTKDVRLSN